MSSRTNHELPSPGANGAACAVETMGLGMDDFRELMRSVDETTRQLQTTHASLQTEVARLQHELAEANEQLRRSRSLAALGEMAAGIAHEIRNPLGSIQLYVQMLGEDLIDQPEPARLCEKIGRAVTSLDAIVRDVLLFSRDTVIRPVATCVSDLINQALISCDALIVGGNVELDSNLPDDSSCMLHADACLMTQAIGNIIRNAVEAMDEAGARKKRIVVDANSKRVRCPDGKQAQRVVIAVEDSGPGVPKEVNARMFNPFFTTRKTGTGLGLAIVHRIVDAHGGHINVKNVKGSGARVELCLPRNPNRQIGGVEPDPASEIEVLAADLAVSSNGAINEELLAVTRGGS